MTKKLKTDQIIGIGAILVAAFFFYHTRTIRVPENMIDPGPRLMPYLAQLIMVICGVGMIVESERKNEPEKEYLSKQGWIKLGIIFGVIIAYAIGLTYLGFIITTPIVAFVLIRMLGEGTKISHLKTAIIAVVLTATIYLIFSEGFGVMLPQGIF